MYHQYLHIHCSSCLDDLKLYTCFKSVICQVQDYPPSWAATGLPDEVVWGFGRRLWLTAQPYDGQSLVATVMTATALWPWCFLFTLMLYGKLETRPSDADLQLTSRCPLLKSLAIQISRVQPSLSPDKWTGGASDASTSPSTPPKRWCRTTWMVKHFSSAAYLQYYIKWIKQCLKIVENMRHCNYKWHVRFFTFTEALK